MRWDYEVLDREYVARFDLEEGRDELLRRVLTLYKSFVQNAYEAAPVYFENWLNEVRSDGLGASLHLSVDRSVREYCRRQHDDVLSDLHCNFYEGNYPFEDSFLKKMEAVGIGEDAVADIFRTWLDCAHDRVLTTLEKWLSAKIIGKVYHLTQTEGLEDDYYLPFYAYDITFDDMLSTVTYTIPRLGSAVFEDERFYRFLKDLVAYKAKIVDCGFPPIKLVIRQTGDAFELSLKVLFLSSYKRRLEFFSPGGRRKNGGEWNGYGSFSRDRRRERSFRRYGSFSQERH